MHWKRRITALYMGCFLYAQPAGGREGAESQSRRVDQGVELMFLVRGMAQMDREACATTHLSVNRLERYSISPAHSWLDSIRQAQ